METGKKRQYSPNYFRSMVEEDDDDDDDSQINYSKTKRTCNSFSTSSEKAESSSSIQPTFFSPQLWSQMEALFRRVVREEMNTMFKSHYHFLPSSSMIEGFETKFELRFLNQIASTIFTNNDIEAENGDALQVALIDVNNSNAIVSIGPLSTAQIEVVVLDGDLTKFINQRILFQRDGKRPLIVGNDLKLHLRNGVGFIKSLSFTDNSSWLRSKQFRLGVRIKDDKILENYPRIGEAISQPFRVLDHRGEVNKKHHPPTREDKVWRLEGISKNGVYHNILSSQGIETVDDFLKIYNDKGPPYLKKLLGKKVPNKTWKAMINNALECVPLVNFDPSFEIQNFVGSDEPFEGNIEGIQQRNLNDHHKFSETTLLGFGQEWEWPMLHFEDQSLFLLEELASTSSIDNEL